MTPWSGLGYAQGQPYGGYSWYLSNAQHTENAKWGPLFANAFPRMRMIVDTSSGAGGMVSYPNSHSQCLHIWYAAAKSYNPNLYVLYGTTNNISSQTLPELSTFIPSAYLTYKAYMLAEAQWAQDNLVDAFCVGNENLISTAHANVGMIPTSITRASNIATATFSYAHGLTSGDYIFVSSGTDTSYRVADSESSEAGVICTVVSPTVITYPSTGSDGSGTGSYKVNWTAYEVVRKTKALAAAAQAIFTRGPIVYSESQGHTTPWTNIGITPGTDIDLWAWNGYGTPGADLEVTTAGYDTWKTDLDALYTYFGANMIITEFNCVQDSGNHKVNGLDKRNRGYEVNHAKEMTRRLNYVKSLTNITQCYYYSAVEGSAFFARDYVSTYNLAYFKNGSGYRQVYNALREEPMDRLLLGNGFT